MAEVKVTIMKLTDIDADGGYSLYYNNELIGRLYFKMMKNKVFYDVVRTRMPREDFERILDRHLTEDNENWYLTDNLTGTRVPNRDYTINYLCGTLTSAQVILNISRVTKFPRITENVSVGTSISKFIKQLLYLFGEYTYSFIEILKNGYSQRYSRWAETQLIKNVEYYLKSQDSAIIDLRRGEHFLLNKSGKMEMFYGTDDVFLNEVNIQSPLKKEHFVNIKSFVLALPGECTSKTYQELRSSIAPEKVIELTVFSPKCLLEFQEYHNIRRLNLLNADDLISFEGITSFHDLEYVYCTGEKDFIENIDKNGIRKNIVVDMDVV